MRFFYAARDSENQSVRKFARDFAKRENLERARLIEGMCVSVGGGEKKDCVGKRKGDGRKGGGWGKKV